MLPICPLTDKVSHSTELTATLANTALSRFGGALEHLFNATDWLREAPAAAPQRGLDSSESQWPLAILWGAALCGLGSWVARRAATRCLPIEASQGGPAIAAPRRSGAAQFGTDTAYAGSPPPVAQPCVDFSDPENRRIYLGGAGNRAEQKKPPAQTRALHNANDDCAPTIEDARYIVRSLLPGQTWQRPNGMSFEECVGIYATGTRGGYYSVVEDNRTDLDRALDVDINALEGRFGGAVSVLHQLGVDAGIKWGQEWISLGVVSARTSAEGAAGETLPLL